VLKQGLNISRLKKVFKINFLLHEQVSDLTQELRENRSINEKYVSNIGGYQKKINQLAQQVSQYSQNEAERKEAMESMVHQIKYFDTRLTELQQENVTLILELEEARKETTNLKINQEDYSKKDKLKLKKR